MNDKNVTMLIYHYQWALLRFKLVYEITDIGILMRATYVAYRDH